MAEKTRCAEVNNERTTQNLVPQTPYNRQNETETALKKYTLVFLSLKCLVEKFIGDTRHFPEQEDKRWNQLRNEIKDYQTHR